MKIDKFETREQWMQARLGKITGTGLKDIANKTGPSKEAMVKYLEEKHVLFDKKLKKEELETLLSPTDLATLESQAEDKIGFYNQVAERLSVSEEDLDGYISNETPLARGTRLQTYAIDRFKKETGKKVDESIVLWSRDKEAIAVSPDGVISKKEAVETKCLSSARHVEAYLTKEIPEEYYFQTLQYFIVNDDLETLHVVFYDTRLPAINYFVFELHRKDLKGQIERYLELQKLTIARIDKIVSDLTF